MNTLSFATLPLSPGQLQNLADLGYREMTPIQAAALPPALEGLDLIGKAKTGSGKTAAFAIPLLTRLNPRDFGCQALVLCPTRELASQVAVEIRRLARYQANIKVVTLCGGQAIGPQIGSLQHGAHVVVGTPGRIKDHLRKQTLELGRVATLVLDEADRMLEMGFQDDIEQIIGETPDSRQTLLFSATFPTNIVALSQRYQRSAQQVSVEAQHNQGAIRQHFFLCEHGSRVPAVVRLLQSFRVSSAIIFCNTRETVSQVCAELRELGIHARALHGDMEQRDREQVLIQFTQQSCPFLVATDVAARGLDVDDLPFVINLDLPRDTDTYVHRIGRTGRAGKGGRALSLFSDSERHRLARIEEVLGQEIEFQAIEEIAQGSGVFAPPPFITLCIQGGRKDKIRPGDILGALTGQAGIDGAAVGQISVTDHAAYVAIARDTAKTALTRLQEGKIKGRKFRVRRL